MIRFVYIGGQISFGNFDFAFYDTVTDSFVRVYDTEVFHSLEDLCQALEHSLLISNKDRFIEKVWQPHKGHIVEAVDALREFLDGSGQLGAVAMTHLDNIREGIVRMEVENEMRATATPLTE